MNDMLRICKHDKSGRLLESLRITWRTSRSFIFLPRLMVALFASQPLQFASMALFTILEGIVRIAPPVLLSYFLGALSRKDTSSSVCFMWGAILGGANFLQALNHHLLFMQSYRIGWNWKNATTALIFENIFHLQQGNRMNRSTTSDKPNEQKLSLGTGNLVNLASNDVTSFEALGVFFHFVWESFLEIAVIIVFLSIQLDVYSALAALAVTILFVPIQFYVANRFTKVRGQTAKSTDTRVKHISEIIDGITSVKSYGWEVPFYKLIHGIRNRECQCIDNTNTYRAINVCVAYSSMSITLFAAFSVFWYDEGTLTLTNVFSALSLLQTLRQTIGVNWIYSLQFLSAAMASCKRIEEFLDFAESQRDAAPQKRTTNAAKDDESKDDNSSPENAPETQPDNGEDNVIRRESLSETGGGGEGSKARGVEEVAVPAVTREENAPAAATTNEASSNNIISTEVFDLSATTTAIEQPVRQSVNLGSGPRAGVDPILSVSNSRFTYASSDEDSPVSMTPTLTPETDQNETRHLQQQESSKKIDAIFSLTNINLKICRGELLMVVGPVGCGKSSLLSALLGEIRCADGTGAHLTVGAKYAFCTQQPWIIAASARANVTMAGTIGSGERLGLLPSSQHPDADFKNPKQIDDGLYRLAVESSRLTSDFELWPAYDLTEIGERGISISGGQKARVALARAIYSDADVYLLDDPLSAVDADVGKGLFYDAIVSKLRDRGKAVVLASHQLQYLSKADRILVLNSNGEQIFCGNYEELMAKQEIIQAIGITSNSLTTSTSSSNLKSANSQQNLQSIQSSTDPSSSLKAGGEDWSMKPAKAYDAAQFRKALFTVKESQDMSMRVLNSKSFRAPKNGKSLDLGSSLAAISRSMSLHRWRTVEIEDKAVGEVTSKTYVEYIMRGGIFSGLGVATIMLLSQGQMMIADYWLRWWATESYGTQRSVRYVWIFAILCSATTINGFLRAYTWYKFSLRASSSLHDSCLWAVMHSPLQFFVANPTGRILNRFTKDQSLADESLPFTIFDFIQNAMFCVGSVILVIIALPWILLLFPPIIWIFVLVRQKYIMSSREVKRIEAVSRSPIYADFSAVLDGLVTLRAFRLQERITRNFHQQLDENGRAAFTFMIINRWIGFRLDMEVAVLVFVFTMMAAGLRDSIDVGLIGFTMVYILGLSALFQWAVRQSAEVETQMTAIERLCEYTQLAEEPGYFIKKEDVVFDDDHLDHPGKLPIRVDDENHSHSHNRGVVNEPVKVGSKSEVSDVDSDGAPPGTLDIRNLTVTYREDLDPVLSGLSIRIPAGSKVGVCGRTGSGKSSLMLALLRLNNIIDGDIILDGKSMMAMSLEEVRSQISIVPQDAQLFSGTIRYNLDPFSASSDADLWSALEDAHIKDVVARDADGLNSHVTEGGKNFSVGQRQLLSLARCILRKSKVVLMDEVTASIDYQTDKLVQSTIRSAPTLRDATIITIAHRLRTIADSDIIVVISAGQLVEVGSPLELLQKDESFFKSLVEQSNDYNDILAIAASSSDSKQRNIIM